MITGGPLKTLPLLISCLNASVCVYTFTCIWKYSSWILLDVNLCIPPSGFWSLKEITIVPSISYLGARLLASTYLSLCFFPFYCSSIHLSISLGFSLHLIISQRSVSYPPWCHVFTMRHLWTEHIWLLTFTHAAVIVSLPFSMWR